MVHAKTDLRSRVFRIHRASSVVPLLEGTSTPRGNAGFEAGILNRQAGRQAGRCIVEVLFEELVVSRNR